MFPDQISSRKGAPPALLLYELSTQWNSLSGPLSWASGPGGGQSVGRGGKWLHVTERRDTHIAQV